MSKKTSFSPSKAAKAALGNQGFVGHTPELLRSESWRTRSIHVMRLLDYFELEHLAHAGKENGFLCATYRQLVKHGIGMRFIKPAIEEAVARGLLKITHQGGYQGAGRQNPSRYQVTYLPWKLLPAIGPPQYLEPSNEWKNHVGNKPKSMPRTVKPQPNGHDRFPLSSERPKMKATKRERERERYLKVNAVTFGVKGSDRRWAAYEQLIIAKYGDGTGDLEIAWKQRDLAHARPH